MQMFDVLQFFSSAQILYRFRTFHFQDNNEEDQAKRQPLVNGEDAVAEAASHKEATPAKPDDVQENSTKTDIVNSAPDELQNNKFVLTPDYIQQSEYIIYRKNVN